MGSLRNCLKAAKLDKHERAFINGAANLGRKNKLTEQEAAKSAVRDHVRALLDERDGIVAQIEAQGGEVPAEIDVADILDEGQTESTQNTIKTADTTVKADSNDDEILTGYRSGGNRKGLEPRFGNTEGNGVYIAYEEDSAMFFSEDGKVDTLKYRKPKKPLIVNEERIPLLDEEYPLYDKIKKSDSEWIRLNKLAAIQAQTLHGVTPENYNPTIIGNELTKLMIGRGYDAVDVTSGGEKWIVLLDDDLLVSTVVKPETVASEVKPADPLSNDETTSEKPEEPQEQKAIEEPSAQQSRRATHATGITEQSLRAVFTRKFPQLSKALDAMLKRGSEGKNGGVVLIHPGEDMAAVFADKTGVSLDDARKSLQMSDDVTKSSDGSIQAFFDPSSGIFFMVAENIDADTAANVLMHEAVHGNQRDNVDAAGVRLLTKQRKVAGGKLREVLDEAANRMVAAGAARWDGKDLIITDTKEAAAYVVEVAAGKAREAGFSSVDGKFMDFVDGISATLGRFVRDFVASIRSAILRYGMTLKNPTVDDLLDYAQASMRRAAKGDVMTREGDPVSGSEKEQSKLIQAWKLLSENDALFQYPVSESKDMEQIFTDVAPDIVIEHSGGDADLEDAWMVYQKDDSGNPVRSNPGFVLLYKDGSVELNVYQFGEGKKGSQVYSAVGNYANNNGLKFKGDRLGITETGLFRRLENMISLALKFGTTDFMQPHPEQLSKMGIDWKDGRTDHNIEQMLMASYNDTVEKFPKIKDIYYDFDNGQFRDSSGNEVAFIDPRGEDTGERFSRSSMPGPNIIKEARAAGLRVGEATIKRAALSNTFLREETGNSVWGRISEFLRRWSGGEMVKDFVGIAYSKSSGSNPQSKTFNIPSETASEGYRRHWQDAIIRWKKVQDTIQEQGGTVGVFEDVEAAMKRYPGRVGEMITIFTRDVVEPLFKRMAKQKTNMEDIGEYLYALHAKDRNAYIQGIRKDMPDNGSGMSNAEADAILKEYQDRPDFKEFEKLALDFQGITKQKLDLLVNNGVITQDQRDAMNSAMGDHYVPLKGFEEIDEEGNKTGNGSGVGFSTNRKLDKRAYGRSSKAGQIVENIIRDYERGILAAEKANVGRYLKNLVENNPDATLWTVDKAPRQPVMGKNGVHYMPSQYDAENEVQYIEDGKPIRIQLHDQLLARAYNNLGVEQMDSILKASASVNALLRQMWTQKNPSFFLINPIRDISTSVMTNTGSEGAGFAFRTLTQLPKAFKAAISWERNKHSGLSKEWESTLKWYGSTGSRTGAAFVDTIESKSLKLQEILNKHGGLSVREEWQNYGAKSALKLAFYKTINNRLMDVIEHLNGGFENMTRLATFKQYLDDHGGVEKINAMPAEQRAKILAQAGKLAKNVTVNFNQRGEYGANANALYLFFNANVQGTSNVIRSVTTAKHRNHVRAMVGGLVMLGMMLAMATDDEDDELTPEHVKNRNLVFHIGGNRYQLPMPYGFSWFVDVGRLMGDVASGRKDTMKASVHLLSSLFANFSPLGDPIHEGKGTAADAVLMMTPTVLKPGAMIGMNRGAFGNQLMPESQWNEGAPDRTKMWRSTRGSAYDAIANSPMLAWADVSPESLKTLFQYVTGGAGRFASDTYGSATGIFDGKPFDVEKTPIISKFIATNDVEEYRGKFYERISDAEKTLQEINSVNKANPEKALEMAKKNRTEVAIAKRSSAFKKQMKALRDAEDAARSGGRFDDVERYEQKQMQLARNMLGFT